MSGGPVRILDTAVGITADRAAHLPASRAYQKANFWLDLTAITRTTGTFDLTLYWSPDGSSAGAVVIAQITGLTAAGLVQLPIEAAFIAAEDSIPEPNLVIWNLVGDATAVSGRIYAMYGA